MMSASRRGADAEHDEEAGVDRCPRLLVEVAGAREQHAPVGAGGDAGFQKVRDAITSSKADGLGRGDLRGDEFDQMCLRRIHHCEAPMSWRPRRTAVAYERDRPGDAQRSGDMRMPMAIIDWCSLLPRVPTTAIAKPERITGQGVGDREKEPPGCPSQAEARPGRMPSARAATALECAGDQTRAGHEPAQHVAAEVVGAEQVPWPGPWSIAKGCCTSGSAARASRRRRRAPRPREHDDRGLGGRDRPDPAHRGHVSSSRRGRAARRASGLSAVCARLTRVLATRPPGRSRAASRGSPARRPARPTATRAGRCPAG